MYSPDCINLSRTALMIKEINGFGMRQDAESEPGISA
jgi:hypothetical protein